ncbi:MAG: hypothetical protein DRJ98_04860 [Thermoprotei archaeon]|mgnify:CR=1 FL=1|nr:MAG: hypothetical protein DRJ52_03285 [Thermoprotei archaeon]RLF10958.1 MAG: hypothetical protein DRJ98_04860 [Thermoprotei archaeon]HDI75478.1 hypothetical protein [Thermoprotei archaeon]
MKNCDEKNNVFEKAVIEALILMISKARGTCVSFESVDIAKLAGLPINAYVLYSIKKVLYRLMKAGMVRRLRRRRGRIFVISKDSPLWEACKEGNRERLSSIVCKK